MSLRGDLIKLAHSKPELRQHLVPLVKQANANFTYRDTFHAMLSAFQLEIRNALAKIVNGDGFKLSRLDMTQNGFMYGRVPEKTYWIFFNLSMPGNKTVLNINLGYTRSKIDKTIVSRDITDMVPADIAKWTWKNIPASFKQ